MVKILFYILNKAYGVKSFKFFIKQRYRYTFRFIAFKSNHEMDSSNRDYHFFFLGHLKPLAEETCVIKEIRFKGLHGPNPKKFSLDPRNIWVKDKSSLVGPQISYPNHPTNLTYWQWWSQNVLSCRLASLQFTMMQQKIEIIKIYNMGLGLYPQRGDLIIA